MTIFNRPAYPQTDLGCLMEKLRIISNAAAEAMNIMDNSTMNAPMTRQALGEIAVQIYRAEGGMDVMFPNKELE